MAALPLATSFPLPDGAMARLEALLWEGEAHVASVVLEELVGAPLACLAFVFTEEHDLPFPSYTAALSESERASLVAEKGPDVLWSPAEWQHWDFLPPPRYEVYERAEVVAADLQEAGCEGVEGAYLAELAYRLSRADWARHGVATAPDFACWPMDHNGPPGQDHETFRVTARPEVVDSYAAAGWLPPDSEASVERTLREAGASEAAAGEIVGTLSELFSAEEIVEWLGDPMLGAEELGTPEREQLDLLTPLQAIGMGRADAVLALARDDFGD